MFSLLWEREGAGRNINQLPLVRTPAGDGTRNLGVCPDQEFNPRPFGLWDDAPTNWATLTGARAECFLHLMGPQFTNQVPPSPWHLCDTLKAAQVGSFMEL